MYDRARTSFLAGLCLLALTGPAAADEQERSPFAGKFSGAWTFKSSNVLYRNNQRGKLTLSISASGKVTGKLENLTYKVKADVKGSIDADGELEVTFELSGQTYTLKGTVSKTKRGGLTGTVEQYYTKGYPVGTIELDLAGGPPGRPASGGKPAPPTGDTPPAEEKKAP